jgi:bacteriorhodopsin
MGPKMTTWRASLWARWLGWTVVFGLVAAASVVANSAVRSAFPSVAGAELVVPCSVAAFLIGLRIRSWWWLAGPAVVVMVLFVAMGLTSRELARHSGMPNRWCSPAECRCSFTPYSSSYTR